AYDLLDVEQQLDGRAALDRSGQVLGRGLRGLFRWVQVFASSVGVGASARSADSSSVAGPLAVPGPTSCCRGIQIDEVFRNEALLSWSQSVAAWHGFTHRSLPGPGVRGQPCTLSLAVTRRYTCRRMRWSMGPEQIGGIAIRSEVWRTGARKNRTSSQPRNAT